MKRLPAPIQRQMDANAAKNLLFSRLDRIMEIDPVFLAALEESLSGDHLIEDSLGASAALAADALVERIYAINQFVSVDGPRREALAAIYRNTWAALQESHDIPATLRGIHYPALSRWIADLYPPEMGARLRDSPAIGRVACSEYSPVIQLEILRVDPAAMMQPVLDIGCGSQAALVGHLRGLGIEAHGVDRHLASSVPRASWLRQTDWMEYTYAPRSWGTIVSNMAFSNHLVYVDRFDRPRLGRYLAKLDEILASLLPGGSFHYAPGVPFVEDRLPAGRYAVESVPVFGGVRSTRITKKP